MSAISFSRLLGSFETVSIALWVSSLLKSLLLCAGFLAELCSSLSFCFLALSLHGGPLLLLGNNRETMPVDWLSANVGSLSFVPAQAAAAKASEPQMLVPHAKL